MDSEAHRKVHPQMIDATYAEGVEPSPYLDLENKEEDNQPQEESDDFELDPAKVCAIDDLDCEACQ